VCLKYIQDVFPCQHPQYILNIFKTSFLLKIIVMVLKMKQNIRDN